MGQGQTFSIFRGVVDGDPLSPYLFILGLEVLSRTLQSSDNLTGLEIKGQKYLNFQYADDMFIFLKPTGPNLKNLFKLLEEFTKISGLRVNVTKSMVVRIGSLRDSQEIIDDIPVVWHQGPFKLLGIIFHVNLDRMINLNFGDRILSIGRLLNLWRGRHLTLVGKIQILKALIVPKISFLFYALPTPPCRIMKQL